MAAGDEKNGDFYRVLGLKKECSPSDLKNSYRKLALRWHPDRFSASGNSKFLEEAKEKFQTIQKAYSVLSDSNKRFLYDVGVYDSDDDENGMGDFLGEMAQMMSQTKPSANGPESFKDLQELFVEMFHEDLDGPFGGPSTSDGYDCFSSSSSGVPLRSGNNGSNKRGNSGMNSGKAKDDEFDSGPGGFCFGSNDSKDSCKGRGVGDGKKRNGSRRSHPR